MRRPRCRKAAGAGVRTGGVVPEQGGMLAEILNPVVRVFPGAGSVRQVRGERGGVGSVVSGR